jgi:hypothetical protein
MPLDHNGPPPQRSAALDATARTRASASRRQGAGAYLDRWTRDDLVRALSSPAPAERAR